MKYKKDNKLPNTKNVRRKTNPAGVTTIIQPKSTAGATAAMIGGGRRTAGGATAATTTTTNNQTSAGGGGGGLGGLPADMVDTSGMGGVNSYVPSPGGGGGGGGQMPPLPPGSLKQEPGQYGLTSL